MTYTIDVAFKKIVLDLMTTTFITYKKGANTLKLDIPKINVDDYDKDTNNNIGMLSLVAKDKALKEVCNINMVVQIIKEFTGQLNKCILSPLD